MSWFDQDESSSGSRWRRPYDYAAGYAQKSPTTFTGALLGLAWVALTLWTHQGTFQDVAKPLMEALTFIALFLANNIHARRAHRQIDDALGEAQAAREEATAAREHIQTTHQELSVNTEQTVSAAESAKQAEAAAKRVEDLVGALAEKIDQLHQKGAQK